MSIDLCDKGCDGSKDCCRTADDVQKMIDPPMVGPGLLPGSINYVPPKSAPLLVGIMGNAGAGKDTIADMLDTWRGFTKLSFADPMKRFCREIFDFSHEQLWGPKEAKEVPDPRWDGLTPRRALQLLGTEWGRQVHPDVWVRYAMRTAKDHMAGRYGGGVVFADCRFVNEFDAIKASGGMMVRVLRPGYEGDGHKSETEQRALPDGKFDYVIHNEGTLLDLGRRVALMHDRLVRAVTPL